VIEENEKIPSIVLAVSEEDKSLSGLDELFNGIEEEEIPISVQAIEDDDTVVRAHNAALSSKLAVGIAFDQDIVVLHHKNLKEREPLFVIDRNNQQMLRSLGANAARLVKGTPFKKIEGRNLV